VQQFGPQVNRKRLNLDFAFFVFIRNRRIGTEEGMFRHIG
jgi:hypothetical protein